MASDFPAADLPFLATLARSPRPADRGLWLRVATDYFLTGPFQTRPHGAGFAAELAERLRDADDATRLAVARKLAPCAEAAEVLSALESLGGQAALHVLQCAAVLPRERLLAAAAGDNARARAVARREDLDAELVAVLADHGEIEVLIALARNRRAPIDPRLYAALARRAKQRIEGTPDRRLAEALLDGRPRAWTRRRCSWKPIRVGAPRSWPRPNAPRSRGREPPFNSATPRRRSRSWSDSRSRPNPNASSAPSPRRWSARSNSPTGSPAIPPANRSRSRSPRSALRGDVAVRVLTSRDLQDGADYRRVGALARLKDALNPAAAGLVMAAMIGDSARPRARHQPVLDPGASTTPSRPSGAAASQDPARAAPRTWIKETQLTPAVLRRRRAFAFAAGRRLLDDFA